MVSLTSRGEHMFKDELVRLGIKGILKIRFDYEQDEIYILSSLIEDTVKIKEITYVYNNMGKSYAKYCYEHLIEKYPEIIL